MSSAWRVTALGAGLYLLVGANLPYLPVWLEKGRGFSGTQISAMVAVATLIRIFAGPIMAARAEQVGLANVIAQISIICLLAFGALLPQATPFFAVIVLVVLTHTAWGVLMPLADAVLISGTKGQRPDYGMARAIASVSFIVASLGGGALVQLYGPEAALWWLVGASGAMVVASLFLPKQAALTEARPSLGQTLRAGFMLYRDRRILLAGLGASLIQSAHAYYYNLGTNIWSGQGIGAENFGPLWSTGVAVEVVFLLVSGILFLRWSPGLWILLGGIGAVVRWTLAGFAPSLEYIYALQTLHAFSFAATHIGILRFLAEELPEEKVPVALAINNAVMFGPLIAVAGVVSGLYYDARPDAQAGGYWLMAGVALLGCLCTLAVVRRVEHQPQSADIGGAT